VAARCVQGASSLTSLAKATLEAVRADQVRRQAIHPPAASLEFLPVSDGPAELAVRVADAAQRIGATVAVAESLTAGALARELAAAPGASVWFGGGIVAYRAETKFRVLSVTEGPVMTSRCAEEMARGACDLFEADFSIATTGVGGPDQEEGHPAGTVFVAVAAKQELTSQCLRLDGDVDAIISGTVEAGLEMLLSLMPD
jgi:nicotinamide-nucleotide amidase